MADTIQETGRKATRETSPAPSHVRRRKPRGILVPLWLGYVFLYIPIVIVVIMSFNASKNLFIWKGFSLDWYGVLFRDPKMMGGLANSIIVAAGATAIATVLGTLLAYGIARYTRGALIRAFAIAPAVLPDLLLGIGLLSLFSFLGFTLGLYSAILAHAVFATAFVTAIVLARLATIDPSLEEASRDLGASETPHLSARDPAAARPGDHRGGAPGVHPLDRRVRDRLLHQRLPPSPHCPS